MLTDSHCHLTYPQFAPDVEGVLQRAAAAGVGRLLTICTELSEVPAICALITQHAAIYGTVGIHPCEVAQHEGRLVDDIVAAALSHNKILALGECGLDFYHPGFDRALQEKVFEAHLEAMAITQLPLVIHNRLAEEAMIAIWDRWDVAQLRQGRTPGIVHCFTGTQEFATAALDRGFYISISGIVTFKNAADLRGIVENIPLDRLLVETDAPYLAPTPHRGQRNEPSYVTHTAQCVATIKGVSFEELAAITTANFETIVGAEKVAHA